MFRLQPSSVRQPPTRRPSISAASLAVLLALGLGLASTIAVADYRRDVGYTRLQQDLGASIPDGTNVIVTQVEAGTPWMPNIFDAEFAFKTITNASNAGGGLYSTHATGVGHQFYGISTSIAPEIATIAAFSANDWIGGGFLRTVTGTSFNVAPLVSTSRIGNHSWVGTAGTAETYVLRRVDWLVETDEFIQVVGLDNGCCNYSSTRALLASASNVIAAGRSDGQQLLGSAPLNPVDSIYPAGRTRPDLVGPADDTSTATSRISAAAALLVQTGHADPGLSTDPVSVSMTNRSGAQTGLVRNAERSEVIKAALMAGADRVTHNSAPNPTNLALYRGATANQTANGLDRRYGAGQLNIRNSYWIIAGGEQNSTEDGNAGANVASRGFDYDPHFGGATYTGGTGNTTATYPLPIPAQPSVLTASLVWNLDIKGEKQVRINGQWVWVLDTTATFRDLNVALIDLANGNAVVSSSASTLENTENLWVMVPANAQYALRVTRPVPPTLWDWDYGLAWQLLPDTDADGVYDDQDNCISRYNPTQLDANDDGYGNFCDGDLDDNGIINTVDYSMLRTVLNQPATESPLAAAADLNGDGTVSTVDYSILRDGFNEAPGPSGLAPAP